MEVARSGTGPLDLCRIEAARVMYVKRQQEADALPKGAQVRACISGHPVECCCMYVRTLHVSPCGSYVE
jgi:hypothetical protein